MIGTAVKKKVFIALYTKPNTQYPHVFLAYQSLPFPPPSMLFHSVVAGICRNAYGIKWRENWRVGANFI